MKHYNLLPALAMLLAICLPAMAQDNPLVQRGIPAEATAENAVQARERAHASARRLAWQRVAAATGSTQNPSDSALEGMVSALIVEEERTTPTRYVGRLTVQFASGTAGLIRPSTGGGGLNIPMPAQGSVEATADIASLQDWALLRRRLMGAESTAGLDILAMSTDAARLRLSLRAPPAEAQAMLAQAGVWVDSSQGAVWRIGLAPGR